MDTKHTAEMTAHSMAPAKPAPILKSRCEPEPQDPVPSVPLSGLEDDPLPILPAAFSGLPARTPEGKAKEKETEEGGAEDNPEGGLEQSPSATENPATSSPTATTLRATHPAASSPTTTPSAVEGTGFTGMPYITPGVERLATEPTMAHPVSERVASCSSYVRIHEPDWFHATDPFPGAPIGVFPPIIHSVIQSMGPPAWA